jgi:hypothetical protein
MHKQSTVTPKIWTAIQARSEPAWKVAERYGISEQTVWKWRGRDDVHDRSHTSHNLQTILTPAQEAVAVALRKALLLPLDDLLALVREFLNLRVSRSGLDCCLCRHGVCNLQALKQKEPKPAHGTFKANEPGYLHIDMKHLPQMADGAADQKTVRGTEFPPNAPQTALKVRTSIAALKDWQRQRPDLFRKRVYNHEGCDNYSSSNIRRPTEIR